MSEKYNVYTHNNIIWNGFETINIIYVVAFLLFTRRNELRVEFHLNLHSFTSSCMAAATDAQALSLTSRSLYASLNVFQIVLCFWTRPISVITRSRVQTASIRRTRRVVFFLFRRGNDWDESSESFGLYMTNYGVLYINVCFLYSIFNIKQRSRKSQMIRLTKIVFWLTRRRRRVWWHTTLGKIMNDANHMVCGVNGKFFLWKRWTFDL